MSKSPLKSNSKGSLIPPRSLDIKVSYPAIEMEVIASSEAPAYLFAAPPSGPKEECKVKLNSNSQYFVEVYYFSTPDEVGLHTDAEKGVALILTEGKLRARFFENGEFSAFSCPIDLSDAELARFKELPKGKINLVEFDAPFSKVISQAIKKGGVLHSCNFRKVGVAQQSVALGSGSTEVVTKNIEIKYLFKKATTVIARPQPGTGPDGAIYQVKVFRRVPLEKKGMSLRPELSDEIELVTQGYMYAEDLKSPYFKKIKETTEDIFLVDPSIDQIKQRSFGDCFLLAVIGGIVRLKNGKGIKYFKKMMIQDESGTTIRFYHLKNKIKQDDSKTPARGDDKPIPHFCKVPNFRHYRMAGLLASSGHDAGWLHGLENGFVMFGLNSENERVTFCPNFSDSYGCGGKAFYALQAVTGKPAEDAKLEFHKLGINKLWGRRTFFDEDKDHTPLIRSFLKSYSLFYSLFDFERIVVFFREINKQMQDLESQKNALDIFQSFIDFDENLEGCKDLTEFNGKFDKLIDSLKSAISTFSPKAKDALLDSLDLAKPKVHKEYKHYLKPGPMGSGKYTLNQLAVFDKVKNYLDGNFILVASSKDQDMPMGIVSNHAYTITGCKQENGILYICLRNPWGCRGLTYHSMFSKVIRSATLGADAQVDLTDFCKYFSRYTVGELPITPSLGLTADKFQGLTQFLKPALLDEYIDILQAGFSSVIDEAELKTSSQPLDEEQAYFIANEFQVDMTIFVNFLEKQIKKIAQAAPELSKEIELKDLNQQIKALITGRKIDEDSPISLFIKAGALLEDQPIAQLVKKIESLIIEIVNLELALQKIKSCGTLSAAQNIGSAFFDFFEAVSSQVKEIYTLSSKDLLSPSVGRSALTT